MKRPFETWILWLLLFVLSVNGLIAGSMMLIRPDGSLLKMDPEWLSGSPFSTYVIPGCLLFSFIGILPALSIAGMAIKQDWRWPERLNIYRNRSWGWTYSLFSGIGTIIWIIIQQFVTKFFILQPVILSMALAIVVLTLMPRTMKYFDRTAAK
jgi:hypothetical protein